MPKLSCSLLHPEIWAIHFAAVCKHPDCISRYPLPCHVLSPLFSVQLNVGAPIRLSGELPEGHCVILCHHTVLSCVISA